MCISGVISGNFDNGYDVMIMCTSDVTSGNFENGNDVTIILAHCYSKNDTKLQKKDNAC